MNPTLRTCEETQWLSIYLSPFFTCLLVCGSTLRACKRIPPSAIDIWVKNLHMNFSHCIFYWVPPKSLDINEVLRIRISKWRPRWKKGRDIRISALEMSPPRSKSLEATTKSELQNKPLSWCIEFIRWNKLAPLWWLPSISWPFLCTGNSGKGSHFDPLIRWT